MVLKQNLGNIFILVLWKKYLHLFFNNKVVMIFYLTIFDIYNIFIFWTKIICFCRCGSKKEFGKVSSGVAKEQKHNPSRYFCNFQHHNYVTSLKSALIYENHFCIMCSNSRHIRFVDRFCISNKKYKVYILR